MNKEQFLKRCANAYDMGLATPEILSHINKLYDGFMRLNGGQPWYFAEALESEKIRTRNFTNEMQLANDKLGYDCIRLLAIWIHPCQICAEDPKEWHTRSGFCPHKEIKK